MAESAGQADMWVVLVLDQARIRVTGTYGTQDKAAAIAAEIRERAGLTTRVCRLEAVTPKQLAVQTSQPAPA